MNKRLFIRNYKNNLGTMSEYMPKCLSSLEKMSLFLGKESKFMRNLFIKFFICFNFEDESACDLFNEDHYYIVFYLILVFKDNQDITEDQIIAIIYLLYSIIIDDNAAGTDYTYPALEKYSKLEFSNILLQFNIKLSGHIFRICNDDLFMTNWKTRCVNILLGHEKINEEQLLLKEIKTCINKSIYNNGRSSPKGTKGNLIILRG